VWVQTSFSHMKKTGVTYKAYATNWWMTMRMMETSLAAFTGTTPYTLPANQVTQSQQATVRSGYCTHLLHSELANDQSGLQALSRTNKETKPFQFTDSSFCKSNTLCSTAWNMAQSVLKVSQTVWDSPYVLFAVGAASWMRIEWGTDTK